MTHPTPSSPLISVDELQRLMHNPDLRLLDCRFDLADPAAGRIAYEQGHIEGAHYADLEQDLSAPVSKGQTGRHPLPDIDTLTQRLRAWGIDQQTPVVVYDAGTGAMAAARAWWLCRYLGLEDVRVLDGGLAAWQAAGLPLTQTVPTPPPSHFQPQERKALRVTAQEVAALSNSVPLLDARGEPRFLGHEEPIDPVAGHIPGALCVPFQNNLDAKGHFKTPAQLRQRLAPLLGDQPDQAICYCGSGVTACHNILAAAIAGLPLPRLYAGSWSEWITDPKRPVATEHV